MAAPLISLTPRVRCERYGSAEQEIGVPRDRTLPSGRAASNFDTVEWHSAYSACLQCSPCNSNCKNLALDLVGRDANNHPFETVAMVLLPEHIHAIWTLPAADRDYSKRWGWIKKEFTKAWLLAGGGEQSQCGCRRRERRRGVWQRRFWEHTIRDEEDLESHFDYIHYNPVKHGWVKSPRDWPYSSFHRWVAAGHYAIDWAASHDAPLPGDAGE